MLKYTPPLRDLHFVLNDVLAVESRLAECKVLAQVDAASLELVAQESGRFAAERILKINSVADHDGCTWDAGTVRTPPGFKEVYAAFCELGWPGVCAEQSVGGQGLPRIMFSIANEPITSCSHAFGMVAAINHCTSTCLQLSASEELRRQWLPLFASGEVLSSMCMTEPGAGSDLGLLTTKAQKDDAGTYRITGTKIFASGGDHDLTENIVHLVLARTPGSPAGSRGLSLFLVPKRLPDGIGNAVFCEGIEQKMGLHGSPTCTLRFEGAVAWLIGDINRGLEAMFPVMNEARLLSGLQAVGLGEIALQNSWQYALERRQGKSRHGASPCALVEHPDVQRMLLTQKAFTEGGRALVHWTALLIDEASHHSTSAGRAQAAQLLSVLTPIVKGFLTENAQISIGLALQTFGGHGYVVETGIEQLVRDIRITTVYEGTTGIQAQDLLMRKVIGDQGVRVALLFELVKSWIVEAEAIDGLTEFSSPLLDVLTKSEAATQVLIDRERKTPGTALSSCSTYLRMLGHLTIGFLWARMAAASMVRAKMDDRWFALKLETARFYFQQLMPEVATLHLQMLTPASDIGELLH